MEMRQRGRAGRSLVAALVATTMFWSGSTAKADGADGSAPAGTVSLADAVRAALRFDPTLAAHGFEAEARAARVRQEGRLPNPTLAAEVENVARFGGATSAAEAAQTTVSLTQVLELGGKRTRRVAVAELDGRLATRDLERARLDTAAKTTKAFIAGLLAQERVALAEQARTLASESLGAARRQLAAGAGSAIEVARATAAVAQAEATVARRRRESRAARETLAAHWGATADGIEGLAGTLAPSKPPALAALEARLAVTPDLERWTDAIVRAEAGVALEEARRVPDVAVRIGARRFVDAESNALVGEVSLPLPLFDRNADAIAEARARAGKARAEREAARVAAATALRATHAELLAALEQARALDADVLPRARAALRETERGYAEGRLRYLEVLEAERAIAALEDDRLEALARYRIAAAEVERLAAVPAAAAEGERR
jgi:cobalt-zinc-cadmium efflux system outer membrane protein